MKLNKSRVIGAVVMLGLGPAATAAQYTWNFNAFSGLQSSNTINLNGGSGVLGGLTVKGYRTTNTDGTGALTANNVKIFGDGNWGIGVNTDMSSGTSGDEYTTSASWPDGYTVDNNYWDELLVFDSGLANFDWSSVTTGFVYSGSGADTTPKLTYKALDTDPLLASSLSSLMGGAGASTTSIATGQTKSLDPSKNNGRYLVVSGDLGAAGGFDKFKISTVSGQTPEPESLALLGIGVLAMLGMRRRPGSFVAA